MSSIGELAEQFGASESLIERSVEARAAASGKSVDEVLQDWTGTAPDAPPAVAVEPPEPEPSETQREPEATVEDAPPTREPEETGESGPTPPPPPIERRQDAGAVPERRTSIWMVAALFLIPLVGVLYLAINPNGVACGEGGQLAVAFDGSIVNCDGSPFEGRGGGGAEAAALVALGQEVYAGSGQCSSCHGGNGQGGTGPAMAGGAVLVTWPACEDHVRWVELGSDGWSASVGSSYGAQDKPVQGGMPAYTGELSDEDLRAVVAFERIRFGGAPAEETLIECGLITPEEPAEGEEAPTEG